MVIRPGSLLPAYDRLFQYAGASKIPASTAVFGRLLIDGRSTNTGIAGFTVVLEDVSVQNCRGAGPNSDGAGLSVTDANVTAVKCIFSQNSAAGVGGAVAVGTSNGGMADFFQVRLLVVCPFFAQPIPHAFLPALNMFECVVVTPRMQQG